MGILSLANRTVRAERESSQNVEMLANQAAAAPSSGEPPAAVSSALQKLVEFIPTETIAIFWIAVPAATSLIDHFKIVPADRPTCLDWLVFVVLLALTPTLLLLTFLSGLASEKLPFPPMRRWPWWRAFASCIAFAVWAFAVPGNPFLAAPALLMAVWVLATIVSTLLSLLDPIASQWGQD